MTQKIEARSQQLEDVMEFSVLEGVVDVRAAAPCNKCGGNCNQCSQPTCKSTCKSCKREE